MSKLSDYPHIMHKFTADEDFWRDYFAGQAITAACLIWQEQSDHSLDEIIKREAYKIAESMMEERAKRCSENERPPIEQIKQIAEDTRGLPPPKRQLYVSGISAYVVLELVRYIEWLEERWEEVGYHD